MFEDKLKNIALLISCLLVFTGCQSLPNTTANILHSSTIELTNIPTYSKINTPSKTKTLLPTPTITPTVGNLCKDTCIPETFTPNSIPDLLRKIDDVVMKQTTQRTETNVYRSGSYGAASYGYETNIHGECQDTIPTIEILSYCKFERKTSRIHVMSGEIQDTPQLIINESLYRNGKIWIRQPGGYWEYVKTLSEDDIRVITEEAFVLSPFYFKEKENCAINKDLINTDYICFYLNLPRFMKTVYGEEIELVEYLYGNEVVVYYDPNTLLPIELDVTFSTGIKYVGQKEESMSYNVHIEYSQIHKSYNDQFIYPTIYD